MFAKIENNTVIEWPIANIAMLFPNTSFPSPITPDSLPEGYVIVGVMPTPEISINQKIIPGDPILQNEKWVQSWDIVDLTTEEVTERTESMAQNIRTLRNQLLTESDWTQVADAPVDKAIWATYRQALRDITNQSQFPIMVTWSEKPQ